MQTTHSYFPTPMSCCTYRHRHTSGFLPPIQALLLISFNLIASEILSYTYAFKVWIGQSLYGGSGTILNVGNISKHQWHDNILWFLWYQANHSVNTLRPRQNGRHFTDDIFKCIFLNENVWISIKISLKFVPKGPINNIPTLVQIMAWRRPGDKPLSEAMMVKLPTHICVTRPQWVKQ